MQSIENIQEIIDSIDLSSLGDVTATMGTEFSAALKNAVDLKMKGPTFDSFESLVEKWNILACFDSRFNFQSFWFQKSS